MRTFVIARSHQKHSCMVALQMGKMMVYMREMALMKIVMTRVIAPNPQSQNTESDSLPCPNGCELGSTSVWLIAGIVMHMAGHHSTSRDYSGFPNVQPSLPLTRWINNAI